MRIREPLLHLVQRLRRELGQQALLPDRAQRARVLREEDVRRRVVALLGDRRRELGAVAVADVDRDPGRLLELLEETLDEILLPTRVHRDVALLAAAAGEGKQGEQDSGGAESGHVSPCVRSTLQLSAADLT